MALHLHRVVLKSHKYAAPNVNQKTQFCLANLDPLHARRYTSATHAKSLSIILSATNCHFLPGMGGLKILS